jgi:hypothetical protein
VVRDSVRKAWFAGSRFSNGQDPPVREALQDRVHHTKADRANNVAVRTQRVLRGLVVIRHDLEWVESVQVDRRRLREDRHVRVGQRAAQASLISRAKKKVR